MDFADMTLSQKMDHLYSVYKDALKAYAFSETKHQEITEISNSLVSVKNTLQSDIDACKRLSQEAQEVLLQAKRLGLDIEGKARNYIERLEAYLENLKKVEDAGVSRLESVKQEILNLLKEQVAEDGKELTGIGKDIKYELERLGEQLKTELSPFLEQLNDANKTINGFINEAKKAKDDSVVIKGEIIALKQDFISSNELHKNEILTLKQEILTLSQDSIAKLTLAQTLIERFESLKADIDNAGLEDLIREVLTQDKKEIISSIINVIVKEENIQNALNKLLDEAQILLLDIKREGTKSLSALSDLKNTAISEITKLKDEAKNTHEKYYTSLNELYNQALRHITQTHLDSMEEWNRFKAEVKSDILRKLQKFNIALEDAITKLMRIYSDFKTQVEHAKADLLELKETLCSDLKAESESLKQEFLELYTQKSADLLLLSDKSQEQLIALKQTCLEELQTKHDAFILELELFEQGLQRSIEEAKQIAEIITKGTFQKEVRDNLNKLYWNNALSLVNLLDSYFIKTQAHYREEVSEKIAAQVKQDREIVQDAKASIMMILTSVQSAQSRVSHYATQAEWNALYEVII